MWSCHFIPVPLRGLLWSVVMDYERHGIHYYPLSFGTSRHLLDLFYVDDPERPLKGKKVICLPVVVRKEKWKNFFSSVCYLCGGCLTDHNLKKINCWLNSESHYGTCKARQTPYDYRFVKITLLCIRAPQTPYGYGVLKITLCIRLLQYITAMGSSNSPCP